MARKDQMALVGDDPFNCLAFVKLHGLCDGRGEIDVPLLAGFAVDELNFGWESHAANSSDITRALKHKLQGIKKERCQRPLFI